METLIVDFNMREPDGRIPALLLADRAEKLSTGEVVLALDGEGLACRAIVSEVSGDGRYVMLETQGRLRRDTAPRPSVADLLAGHPSRKAG